MHVTFGILIGALPKREQEHFHKIKGSEGALTIFQFQYSLKCGSYHCCCCSFAKLYLTLHNPMTAACQAYHWGHPKCSLVTYEMIGAGKLDKALVSEAVQSCPTFCNPVDCSLPGFSVHGILQARILEWVAISFFRGFSQPRDGTRVSCIGGRHSLSHQRMILTHVLNGVPFSILQYCSDYVQQRVPG